MLSTLIMTFNVTLQSFIYILCLLVYLEASVYHLYYMWAEKKSIGGHKMVNVEIIQNLFCKSVLNCSLVTIIFIEWGNLMTAMVKKD